MTFLIDLFENAMELLWLNVLYLKNMQSSIAILKESVHYSLPTDYLIWERV